MPDLAGWRVENFSEHEQVAYSGHQDVAYFTTAPDWVCEILSPSTRKLDRGRKRDIYAREGVSWLWLPDPGAPTLKRSPCRKADERPSPPSPATRSSRFPPSTTSPFPCPNSVFAVATGNPEAAAVRVARRVAMSNGCHGPASSGSRSPRSAYPAGRLPFLQKRRLSRSTFPNAARLSKPRDAGRSAIRDVRALHRDATYRGGRVRRRPASGRSAPCARRPPCFGRRIPFRLIVRQDPRSKRPAAVQSWIPEPSRWRRKSTFPFWRCSCAPAWS